MVKILIAYTTNEGHVAKIVNAVVSQLQAFGHTVHSVNLADDHGDYDLSGYDGVIVAASVHTGKHQSDAERFAITHHNRLQTCTTAFLSVSLSAAAKAQAGLDQADEQIVSFLNKTDWQPDIVQAVAGAFYYSHFSRLWRWIIKTGFRLANKELSRLGWPDLTRDQEFTDWEALQQFGQRFSDSVVCAEPSG